MVQLYARADYNSHAARRLYAEPQHLESLRRRGIHNPQVPQARTIVQATQRLLDHGQFARPSHAQGGGGSAVHSPELDEEILEYFERDPRRSTRMAAAAFDVSQYYVWKLLNNEGLHPYHFRKVHALREIDAPPRIAFCEWLIRNQHLNILWTDEATFTRVGLFNQRNEHFWSFNNPHVIRECAHQVRFSVNVWAGIVNGHLIGPHFVTGHLTGAIYSEMLRTVIPDLLDDVPLAVVNNLYYQQDGCPAHYQRAVRDILDSMFPERWIGRGGPVPWPPRSPDLTPLDFFLWSELKRLVYRNEYNTRDELISAIVDAFNTVRSDRDTLLKLKDNQLKRARLCIERSGLHFEQLLRYR